MLFEKLSKNYYFNSVEENSEIGFILRLSSFLENNCSIRSTIVLLCIGTDKCVGDSLGPLIGNSLEKLLSSTKVKIFGTLANPVHACNLESTVKYIYDSTDEPFIIAIDASLGIAEHIGFATVKNGPLKPGTGVKKHLPEVGDVCITGIVNQASPKNENALFNSTQLSTVIHLADYISSAVYSCLNDFISHRPDAFSDSA